MLRPLEDEFLNAAAEGESSSFWSTFDPASHYLNKEYKAGFCMLLGSIDYGRDNWQEKAGRISRGSNSIDRFQDWLDNAKIDIGRIENMLNNLTKVGVRHGRK